MTYNEVENGIRSAWANNVKAAIHVSGSVKALAKVMDVEPQTVRVWCNGALASSKLQLVLYKYLVENGKGVYTFAAQPQPSQSMLMFEQNNKAWKGMMDNQKSFLKAMETQVKLFVFGAGINLLITFVVGWLILRKLYGG